jgi:hypothetical protein
VIQLASAPLAKLKVSTGVIICDGVLFFLQEENIKKNSDVKTRTFLNTTFFTKYNLA